MIARLKWLAETISGLFPMSDWKKEIPVFDTDTHGNGGIIWANINQEPFLYNPTFKPYDEKKLQDPQAEPAPAKATPSEAIN